MKNLYLTISALMLCAASYAQTPAPITGPSTMCGGTTITLADATIGGVWSCSAPSIVAVGSATGVVTAVSTGVVTVTYTIGGGGYATHPVTVYPLPSPISGASSVCVGGSITLAASGGGTWSVSSPSVTISAGGVVTGVAAGVTTITYTLSTGCASVMIMTVDPLPAVYSVTGGGSYCAGGAGSAIGISGSGTGVTYTLSLGSTVVSSVTGTGAAMSFGAMTLGGTYAVVATSPSGCSAAMSGTATITVSPLPSAYAVTGGGGYCTGGTGSDVGIANSDPGVNYQLFNGGAAMGAPIPGTGSALDFGMMTAAGVYTIVATNAATGCSATMSGSDTITINPLPTIYSVIGTAATCGGGMDISLSGSASGVNYQLYNSSSTVGSPVSGTGSALSIGVETAASTYTVVASNATTGCTRNMTGSVTVSGNTISGNITYSGGSSTDSFKVWLIQFNPSDSVISAEDSMYTCMASGTPYYEFDGEPAGSYMVKADLLGETPGTSGYIPTYHPAGVGKRHYWRRLCGNRHVEYH